MRSNHQTGHNRLCYTIVTLQRLTPLLSSHRSLEILPAEDAEHRRAGVDLGSRQTQTCKSSNSSKIRMKQGWQNTGLRWKLQIWHDWALYKFNKIETGKGPCTSYTPGIVSKPMPPDTAATTQPAQGCGTFLQHVLPCILISTTSVHPRQFAVKLHLLSRAGILTGAVTGVGLKQAEDGHAAISKSAISSRSALRLA